MVAEYKLDNGSTRTITFEVRTEKGVRRIEIDVDANATTRKPYEYQLILDEKGENAGDDEVGAQLTKVTLHWPGAGKTKECLLDQSAAPQIKPEIKLGQAQ